MWRYLALNEFVEGDMKNTLLGGVSAIIVLGSTAHAQVELPGIAADMLQSAYDTGDLDQIVAVQNALVDVLPTFAVPINAAANDFTKALEGDIAAAQTTAPAVVAEASEAPAATEEAVEAAEDKPEEKPQGGLFAIGPWQGKAIAGVSNATGNSNNSTVGFALDATRQQGKFIHNIDAYFDIATAAAPATDDDPTTPEDESNPDSALTQKRWGAAYKLDYLVSDRLYAFGRVSYDEDQFSGFDYRLFGGAGAGYFISKSDKLTWKVEGGPGYQYSPIDDTREILQNFALYASSETDWQIRDGILFEQDFRVTWTSPTTTLQSITALTTALTENIGAGISYEIRHETNPPLGRENTDTILRANLSYGF